jgi:hypothetical protein
VKKYAKKRNQKDELMDWYGGKQGHHKISKWQYNTQDISKYLDSLDEEETPHQETMVQVTLEDDWE